MVLLRRGKVWLRRRWTLHDPTEAALPRQGPAEARKGPSEVRHGPAEARHGPAEARQGLVEAALDAA